MHTKVNEAILNCLSPCYKTIYISESLSCFTQNLHCFTLDIPIEAAIRVRFDRNKSLNQFRYEKENSNFLRSTYSL